MVRRRQVTYSKHSTHAARSAHARGSREFRTYDTSYINPRSKVPQGPTLIAIVIAVVMAIVLLIAVPSCSRGCSSTDLVQPGTTVEVTVPDGASAQQIGQALVDAKLIANASEFTDAVKSSDAASQLKPGDYQIEGGTSAADIVSMLVSGPSANTLVVPEGYTVSRTADAVEKATDGAVTADDFKAAAANASAYADDYPFVADAYNNSLEGFLFPKTYTLPKDATADSIVRMMLDQYEQEVQSLDYSYAESQGLSAYDVLKLASVVERESDANTRADVASVFYNRLAANTALQSDATIAYVVGHDPTHDDLSVDSPYNTYQHKGLPAGPICSPGLDSLQATCQPNQTDYLYFYFTKNDDGSLNYYFSKTYDEHLQAIKSASSSSSSSDKSSESSGDAASSDNGSDGQQDGSNN
ncbi:MAG: endolytic transglycosylase MltG [Eggerthellaceae bacterium]|jgi:UPF0755 protein|nr:endolytic transglycosylase MltG [Eggerthellaceae bacterium]